MSIFWIIYWVVACINACLATWLKYGDHLDGYPFNVADLVVCLGVVFVPVINIILGLVLVYESISRFGNPIIIRGKGGISAVKSEDQNSKPDSET